MERPTSSPDTNLPVVILTGHVAMKVRLRAAIEPFAPVVAVSSESDLLAHLCQPVRLIVIHGVAPFADARLPARARGATRAPHVPIIVLAASREPAWAPRQPLIASGQVDDVIHTDTERVDALVAAWSLHSDRCRRKVEALRLAHDSTPAPLHQFLEELLLNDSADLSVAAWAASKPDGSRFALRRVLAREGVKPRVLVNVAQMLNFVARVLLSSRGRLTGRLAAFHDARSAQRLLARTMGMTPDDVTVLARQEGPDAVRDRAKRAVVEMLRGTPGEGDAGPQATTE